mgnify:CR=1 FL=1
MKSMTASTVNIVRALLIVCANEQNSVLAISFSNQVV